MRERRWIILAVLFAARAATGFQFQSIGSSANFLMADLAIGYAEIGMLLGAYLLPGVIVAFPTGLLGRRISEKTLGLAGLLLMAVSGLALSYSGDLTTALVARFVGGVGATVLGLVATKMVADWFEPREIVLAMSLLQMSWPFGAMIALPIQAWIGQSFGLSAVMASGGIAGRFGVLRLCVAPANRAADRGGQRRSRKTARCGTGPGDRRRRDLGRDESRLRAVLHLRAAVDGGARILGNDVGLAHQPCDLVHHPRHSGRRLSRSPIGAGRSWRSLPAA